MHRLTLRPAITTHLWDTLPPAESALPSDNTLDSMHDDGNVQHTSLKLLPAIQSLPMPPSTQDAMPVPFLRLPTKLSTRLKNILCNKVATQFRCVPVGRDHNRLTLAMADPTDTNAIHTLHEITGMSIFPVACDRDALEALLAEPW